MLFFPSSSRVSFSICFYLGWSCELLGPKECGRSDCVGPQARSQGLVASALALWEACCYVNKLKLACWRMRDHMEQRQAVPAEFPLGPTSSLATKEASKAFLNLPNPDKRKPLADCKGQSGPDRGATLPTPRIMRKNQTLFCPCDLRVVSHVAEGYRIEFK